MLFTDVLVSPNMGVMFSKVKTSVSSLQQRYLQMGCLLLQNPEQTRNKHLVSLHSMTYCCCMGEVSVRSPRLEQQALDKPSCAQPPQCARGEDFQVKRGDAHSYSHYKCKHTRN